MNAKHHGAPSKIEPPLAIRGQNDCHTLLSFGRFTTTRLCLEVFSSLLRIESFIFTRISSTSGSCHQYHPPRREYSLTHCPDTTDNHKADSTVVDPD